MSSSYSSPISRRYFIEQASGASLALLIPIGCASKSSPRSSSSPSSSEGGTDVKGDSEDLGGNITGISSQEGGGSVGESMMGGNRVGGHTVGGHTVGGHTVGGHTAGSQDSGGEIGGQETGGESSGGLSGGSLSQPDLIPVTTCEVTPPQIEGPYYFDPNLNRSIIHEGRSGIPLFCDLIVVDQENCAPLNQAYVEIWHADAQGLYSGYDGQAVDTRGETFLRGLQITTATGQVRFETIYPGWYPGRAVHVHFKVKCEGYEEITSQYYFPDEISREVYRNRTYQARGEQDTPNPQDRFLQRANAAQNRLITSVEQANSGYRSTLVVSLAKRES